MALSFRSLIRALRAAGLALAVSSTAIAAAWASEIELVALRSCVSGCTKPDCTPASDDPASTANITPEPGQQSPDISPQIANDFGSTSGPESAVPNMLGDFLATSGTGTVTFNDAFGATRRLPATVSPYIGRTFKIGENQSARPQDRLFTDFHYYQTSSFDLARYAGGFEKTFLEGDASFGMRVPYYQVNPDTLPVPFASIGAFGLSTSSVGDSGDLTTFFKYAPYMDRITGETLTVGLAVTAPTGGNTLGGVTPLYVTTAKHRGSIQPFVGFLLPSASGWFAQGFSSIDSPLSSGDTTWWFNDVSVGKYFNRGSQYWISAVIPLVELHVNSPIDGRLVQVTGATPAASSLFGLNSGPAASIRASGVIEQHNQTNFNTAITLEINRRSTLALGLVTPVEGPRPYFSEFQVQFNTFGIGSGPRFRESW